MAEGGNKLSEEQIFECLKSLNVPCRMNDLRTPTREFIVRVFESFIKDLQIDITSHELRTWEATSHIEDGDIYEEPQLLLLLAMSVNHITSSLNITVKDITDPILITAEDKNASAYSLLYKEPKRTKKILNYIIVFWNYYLQKYARFTELEAAFEDERKRAEEIMLENESLDEKYDERLKTLNNMQPSKEELASIVEAKQEKATKLKAECETLQSDYQTLKNKEISIKEETSAVDLNIIKAKERLAELSQLILSSPKQKQLNAEIQSLKDKIKARDVEVKEFEEKYKDELRKLQLLQEVKKEEKRVFTSLNEIEENNKLIKETVKSIVEDYQKLDEEEDKVKRLEMDLGRKQDWQLHQGQKSAKILLNKKKQLQILQEVLTVNQNDEEKEKKAVEVCKSAIVKMQNCIEIEEDRIMNVIKKCKEADALSRERMTQYETKMKEIKDKFKLDCADIDIVFEEKCSIPRSKGL